MAVDFDKINRTVISYKKEQGRATDRELEWLARDTLDRASASQSKENELPQTAGAAYRSSRAVETVAPSVAAAHDDTPPTTTTGAPAVAPAVARSVQNAQEAAEAVETLAGYGKLQDGDVNTAVVASENALADVAQYETAFESKKQNDFLKKVEKADNNERFGWKNAAATEKIKKDTDKSTALSFGSSDVASLLKRAQNVSDRYNELYERYRAGKADDKDFALLAKEKSKVESDMKSYDTAMSRRFSESVEKAQKLQSGIGSMYKRYEKVTQSALPTGYTKETLSRKSADFNTYQQNVYKKFLAGKATTDELAAVGARRESLEKEAALYADSAQGLAETGEAYKRKAEAYARQKEDAEQKYREAEKELREVQNALNNYAPSYNTVDTYHELEAALQNAQKKYKTAKRSYQGAQARYEAAKYTGEYTLLESRYADYLSAYNRAKENGYTDVSDVTTEMYLRVNQKRDTDTPTDDSASLMAGYGSDEQKRVYLYLYDIQGEKAANAYAKTVEPLVKVRYANRMSEKYESSNIVGKIALGASLQTLGGLSDYGMGLVGAAKALTGNDSYTFPSSLQYGAEGVRNAAGSVGGVAMDVIRSVSNMAPSIAVGAVTAGAGATPAVASMLQALSFGASAGGNAYIGAVNEGKDAGESFVYGVTVGASEVLLERAIGGITGFGKSGASRFMETSAGKTVQKRLASFLSSKVNSVSSLKIGTVVGAFGRLLSESTSEFVEEASQELLDPIFRNLIFSENNDVVTKENFENAMYAGALGFLTAGALNLPTEISRSSSLYRVVSGAVEGEALLNDITEVLTDPALRRNAERLFGYAVNAEERFGFTDNDELNALWLTMWATGARNAQKKGAKAKKSDIAADYTDVSAVELGENIAAEVNQRADSTADRAASDILESLKQTVPTATTAEAVPDFAQSITPSEPNRTAADTSAPAQSMLRSADNAAPFAHSRGELAIKLDVLSGQKVTVGSREFTVKGASKNAVRLMDENGQTRTVSFVGKELSYGENGFTVREKNGVERVFVFADELVDAVADPVVTETSDKVRDENAERAEQTLEETSAYIQKNNSKNADRELNMQDVRPQSARSLRPKSPVDSDSTVFKNSISETNEQNTADNVNNSKTISASDVDSYSLSDLPPHTIDIGKNTKTGKTIYVLKLKNRVSTEEYKAIAQTVKERTGGYYSRYVGGFIVSKRVYDSYRSFANENATQTKETVDSSDLPLYTEKPNFSVGDIIRYNGSDWRVTDNGFHMKFENLDPDSPEASFSYVGGMDSFKETHSYELVRTSEADSASASKRKEETKEINSDSRQTEKSIKQDADKRSSAVADVISYYLRKGKKITSKELFRLADEAFDGSMANGDYAVKDAYDALELGVNRYILSLAPEDVTLESMEQLISLLPTQSKRTEEQEAYQQFSTPPTLAYLAAYAANIRPGDVLLEPSAGIGGLAVFGKLNGAKVHVNEIDSRRLAVLKNLPFDGFTSENAEHLNDILGERLSPDVVLMNPPFSSSASTGMKTTAVGAKHVEQGLKILKDGGRLVAVVGRGMTEESTSFSAWFRKIRENYTLRANIGIAGKNYTKYGTNFDVRLLVIDKIGKTADEPITDSVETLSELKEKLEVLHYERTTGRNSHSSQRGGISERQGKGAASADSEGKGIRSSHPTLDGRREQNSVSEAHKEIVGEREASRGIEQRNVRDVSSASSTLDAEGLQEVSVGDDGTLRSVENASAGRPDVSSVGRDESVRTNTSGNGEQPEAVGRSAEMPQGVRGRGTRISDKPQSNRGRVDGVSESRAVRDRVRPDEQSVNSPSVTNTKPESENASVKQSKNKVRKLTDKMYEEYMPPSLPFSGAQKHPTKISESAAMSAVTSPPITYVPKLRPGIIENGIVSDVQLAQICYAGQAGEQLLPDGSRRGYFIGDGGGLGKGRTNVAIIQDSFERGRTKAIWLSKNKDLSIDATRDITALFGDADLKIDFVGGKATDKILSKDNGILFVTYSTLSKEYQKDGSNFDKIVRWFGKDFDGVIIMDECHLMSNAVSKKGSRGSIKASQSGLAGVALQKALPNARFVYSSATGAADVHSLSYADRLGLWGQGTPFVNVTDFISKVSKGGIAAMEMVSRDMKAQGMYLSRIVSCDDVVYDRLTHKITKEQIELYDSCAEAWQIVLSDIGKALEVTCAKKTNAYSTFWSAQQRFFNQIINSFQLPGMIEDMRRQLEDGKSCIVQLTSTYEAAAKEAENKAKEAGLDLEDMDLSPREMLMRFLEKAFPVNLHEEYMDERGNVSSREVTDASGRPVLSREAVQMRDKLMERVGSLNLPSAPIDVIISTFGEDLVAENTGRKFRYKEVNGERIKIPLSQATRSADVEAFQNGSKRIMIFSEAGGTGKSYHADKNAKNKQQRVHYLFEAGWKSYAAVQALFRSNRSGQVSAPIYKLVTTDLRGQMRFISTIAKRLDALGAMTSGQRQTGSQGIFNATDNLEDEYASNVLSAFYKDLALNCVEEITDGQSIIRKMGLDRYLFDSEGRINDKAEALHDITKFLNRILVLKAAEQNQVFDAFFDRLNQAREYAAESGTLDTGLENYKADSAAIRNTTVIRTDKENGAETVYYEISVKNKQKPLLFENVDTKSPTFVGFYLNERTGSIKALYRIGNITDASGNVIERVKALSPNGKKEYVEKYKVSAWKSVSETDAKILWENKVAELPEYKESTLHLISGVLLPIWDRLPEDNPRIYRVLTDEGKILIGREIKEKNVDTVLKNLGFKRSQKAYSSKDILNALQAGGKIELDEGTVLRKSFVSGERRIECVPYVYSKRPITPEKAKSLGMFSERIAYKTRFFVPTDSAEQVIEALLKEYAVMAIFDGADGTAFYLGQGKTDKREKQAWEAKKAEQLDKNGKPDTTQAKLYPLSDIVNQLAKEFKLPIRTGRYKGHQLGQYNTRTKEIRTRYANDLLTIAHELGHHLDSVYKIVENNDVQALIDVLPENFKKQYGKRDIPHEAVAEYFKRYLSNPQTEADAFPDFTAQIETCLTKEDKKTLDEIAHEINAYLSSSFEERFTQTHISAKKYATPKKRSVKELSSEIIRRFRDYFVDDIGAIEELEELVGIDSMKNGKESPYALAFLERKSDYSAAYLLTGELCDMEGNPVGKSYIERLVPVRNELDRFNDYLIAKRAVEIKKRKPGMVLFADPKHDDIQALNQYVENLEKQYPHFKSTSEDVYDYIRQVQRLFGVASGVESENTVSFLERIYPSYVPMFRAVSEKNGALERTKKGYANQSSLVRRLKGSTETLIDPTDSIVALTMRIVKAARRNAVGRALGKIADTEEGLSHLIVRVEPDKLPQTFSMVKKKEALFDEALSRGIIDSETKDDFSDILDSHFKDIEMKFEPYKKDGSNIVTFRDGGKAVYYQIGNERLYKALTTLNSRADNDLALKAIRCAQNIMKSGYVGFNPAYHVGNFTRDLGTAWLSADTMNPFVFIGGYMASAKKILCNDSSYRRFLALGGGHNTRIEVKRLQLQNDLKQCVRKGDMKTAKKMFFKLVEPLALGIDLAVDASNPFGFLKELSFGVWETVTQPVAKTGEFVEQIPRMEAFLQSYEKDGDIVSALMASDEITANFARHGQNKWYNKAFIFGNSAIAGIEHARRVYIKGAFKGSKEVKKKLALNWLKTVMVGIAMTALCRALLRGAEKEYEKLSTYVKNNNYVLYAGDGHFIKIAKPREFALLHSFIERCIERMFGNEDAFYDFGSYLLDNLLPPGVPNVFDGDFTDSKHFLHGIGSDSFLGGLFDIGSNMDYKDDYIVPEYWDDDKTMAEADKYYDSTSNLAIAIGKIFNIAPLKVDYMLNSTLGFVGKLAKYIAPHDSSYQDLTFGIKGKIVADNVYSTDMFDIAYNRAEEAEKRVNQEDATAEDWFQYEQYSLLETVITQTKKSIRNTLTDTEEKREYTSLLQDFVQAYEISPTIADQNMMRLYESTGDTSVFYTSAYTTLKYEYDYTVKSNGKERKYHVTLTPDQYIAFANEALTVLQESKRGMLNVKKSTNTDETSAVAKRMKEGINELKKKYAEKYGKTVDK